MKKTFSNPEIRKKMSRYGEKNPFYGKHHSEETKKKISTANTRRKKTIKEIEQFTARIRGNTNFLGKHHSEETKMKIRNKLLNRTINYETRLKMSKNNVGMLGKHHSEKTKKKLSLFHIKRLQDKKWHYKNKLGGIREDLGHYYRSTFEANFCRILKYLRIKYEYESDKCIFELSNGKHYLCDFYLPDDNLYIELKGYMYEDAKEKIEMFKKEYPNLQFFVLEQSSNEWKFMDSIYKNIIPEWENRKKKIFSQTTIVSGVSSGTSSATGYLP